MDAEGIAQLVAHEARASLPKAARIVGKIGAISTLGFMFASNWLYSTYFIPVGVITLSMAASWFDAIREECSSHGFFPSKTLDSIGRVIFHWRWLALIAVVVYFWVSVGTLINVQLHLQDRLASIYSCSMKFMIYAAAPLALMLLGRAIEPDRFERARADIRNAEKLVRQLVQLQKPSDTRALAQLIDTERIPVYKLASVASALQDIVASFDAKHKVGVDLVLSTEVGQSLPSSTILKHLLSRIYSPFRSLDSNLFLWQSRDIVLYLVLALYVVLLYIGSYYFPLAPLCIFIPFFARRSRVARYLRDLQEDIRLAQGAVVEKKGGMVPEESKLKAQRRVNWPMVGYLAASHIAALYAILVLVAFGGVCPIFGNDVAMRWETIAWAGLLYFCSALGITAGVHRLWSHKSYKAAFPLRFVLMIFNSIANQGCIFNWARDHRVHHLYSDTAADPHDSNRGFWFSHVGWMLVEEAPEVTEATKKLNLSDLYADPLVMFQKRVDPFWNLMCCFVMATLPALTWGDSFWNSFLLAGALRYVLLLNATWAVNSVVHNVGTKPYNPAHCTTENGWVALFAIGEGWHNWHHTFDWDYATAELGALMQFNPTKVFIDIMAAVGLAWDRKRATKVWSVRKDRWAKNRGRPVLESLEGPPLFKKRVITFGPADYGAEDEACHDSKHE